MFVLPKVNFFNTLVMGKMLKNVFSTSNSLAEKHTMVAIVYVPTVVFTFPTHILLYILYICVHHCLK